MREMVTRQAVADILEAEGMIHTVLWHDIDDDDCIEESREFDMWDYEMDEFISTLLIEGHCVRMITEGDDDTE